MKWLPHSLRWRIQLWHGLLLLLVLLVLGIAAYRLESAHLYRQLDEALQVRMQALHDSLVSKGKRPMPLPNSERPQPAPREFQLSSQAVGLFEASVEPAFYFELWARTGQRLGSSSNAPADLVLPKRDSGEHGPITRVGMREMVQFTPPGECLLVGASDASLQRELRHFTAWLGGIGLVVLALGWLGGWGLATHTLAPILHIRATAQRIAAGHLDERIPIAETESELGNLSATLNETFQRLENAFAEQARFTSDAAHELRTPVAIILGQTQLSLSRPRSAEEARETLETIRRSGLRMQHLIDSLLELAQLDDASAAIRQQPCDLAELSREQLDAIRPLAEEKGLTLESDLHPAPCQADRERIAQILTNLLANAVKYCRPNDHVRLTTAQDNGHILVTVADTGPGIAAENLPHLFERFYRADASRSRATGGAGLGLAICKSIAEAHRGELTATSSEGNGTTFTLRLPGL